MLAKEQKERATAFVKNWSDKCEENEHTQLFWIDLLQDVFGVQNVSDYIFFENKVKLGHMSFIDARIKSTKVLIEQKSGWVDLRKASKQSDGEVLTPFQQAKRYADGLRYSEKPKWIVCCNFKSFLVYDMDEPEKDPEEILLENLPKEYHRLKFLVSEERVNIQKEMEISIKAGELVGKIYDALLNVFPDKNSPITHRSINTLCVRLVFCLYAEDSGIFGQDMFSKYVDSYNADNIDLGLKELFKVLNTNYDKRSEVLKEKLKCFPYVNGGLFDDDKLDENSVLIPTFSEETKHILVHECGYGFDWSGISPTIFGAVFESTLNPETRRNGGMHYTSVENIHKVIDPLFMNDLYEEFETILSKNCSKKIKNQSLENFRDKISNLKFLDPACGSGNFLTETFMSLRRLENKALHEINDGSQQMEMGGELSPVKVSIHQFFGIEINDFAATVAMTAMWISECQMLQETENILGKALDFLPLKNYANIVCGNALEIDWNTLKANEHIGGLFNDVGKSENEIHYDFIIGNPPFVGARMMKPGSPQKSEIKRLFGTIKDVHDLDFVCGWYKIVAPILANSNTRCALVSTNSISQGAQVPILWNDLEQYNLKIDFAYKTFQWDSESNLKAHVHCVIIGFSSKNTSVKRKFIVDENGTVCDAKNINGYLEDGDCVYVPASKFPICNVSGMCSGNQARGKELFITDSEKEKILDREPNIKKWIRPLMGSIEYIKAIKRWCFWLKDITPEEIKQSKEIYNRVQTIRNARLSSSAKTTIGYAKVPHLFAQITQPEGKDYILIPRVSSKNRRYVPMGFMSANVVSTDAADIIPNATPYEFGVLTSSVHMAWMRAVCGRLKSDYRYSKEIVYNTFPWPGSILKNASVQSELNVEKKLKIESTAQAIIDVRDKYKNSSFASLYDENTMPIELRKAHEKNDEAVLFAYGLKKGTSESDIVAHLLKLYQKLTKGK